jgi:hypothetical protein
MSIHMIHSGGKHERCYSCHYFHPVMMNGECYRNPPIPGIGRSVVERHETCGEWGDAPGLWEEYLIWIGGPTQIFKEGKNFPDFLEMKYGDK